MHSTNWLRASRKFALGLMLLSLMTLSACGLFPKTVVKDVPAKCEIPSSLTAPINLPPPLEIGSTNGQLWKRAETLETLVNRCNQRLEDVQAWKPERAVPTTGSSGK